MQKHNMHSFLQFLGMILILLLVEDARSFAPHASRLLMQTSQSSPFTRFFVGCGRKKGLSSQLSAVSLPIQSTKSFANATSRIGSACPVTSSLRQPLLPKKEERFDRTAPQEIIAEKECIIEIDNIRYNMTSWARAHPGGEQVLHRFHGKDASRAFDAAAHSKKAYEMLADFAIRDVESSAVASPSILMSAKVPHRRVPRWRRKLFTQEDPRGIHKSLGVFVLLHFAFRFFQMYFGDPSAGLGSRLGKGASVVPALCLIPHAMLSLSSLIFHTVPKERVVGKPMIWQEYRVHNIIFGVRSVTTAFLAWLSYYKHHIPLVRRVAILGSCASVLLANLGADMATRHLRVDNKESTTATMPYWEGCSIETQRRFKSFYAYSQFMASLSCVAVANPAWPLSVLLAIQMASLLMTLVRKGIVSAKGYHIGYTITLCMPYLVGIRSLTRGPDFLGTLALAATMYKLRRRGVSKYVLWTIVVAARISFGNHIMNWACW